MKFYFYTILLILIYNSKAMAQTEEKKWELNGYVKGIQATSFTDLDSVSTNSLLHNRLNFRWYPSDSWKVGIEVRNRLFVGDQITVNPLLTDIDDDGIIDLSTNLIERNDALLNVTMDRLWVQWQNTSWQVTLGRQRVNWGVDRIFNPNDIFNAYSFIDFDYEERPGSDALRVQYFKDTDYTLDMAVKITDDPDELIAAALYKFNKWNYDIQLLGGVYKRDIVIGTGWAGNIRNAGLKTELSYFRNYQNFSEGSGTFISSFSVDYAFKNSLYVYGSYFYNSSGKSKNAIGDLVETEIGVKNLSPFPHNIFTQLSYEFSAITNLSMNILYSPTDNAVFINPALNVLMGKQFDLSIISQNLLGNTNSYELLFNTVYTRIKWNF
ncbi:hypothetical protein JM83_3816 [Gillisia sp. Hel_I_86]|uniref:hypothetical protein n=1 Tax=Gillisia sp. Hel_I_86 TaxID=1249981 RepID=UPI00119A0C3B|nr:hypothetical protein [Gillisia sp. Hel_I_86]TVZ28672.1 hypothetical protein JM83_3816 [Gillisia sp. Hel_I_86]